MLRRILYPSAAARAAALGAVLLALLGLPAAAQDREPRKLAVEVSAGTVPSGTVAEIVVRLQDVNNRPARATASLTVEVELVSPSGRRRVEQATIGPGQGSATLRVPADEPGIVTIRASQPQLLDGGAYFGVVPPSARRTRSVEPGAGVAGRRTGAAAGPAAGSDAAEVAAPADAGIAAVEPAEPAASGAAPVDAAADGGGALARAESSPLVLEIRHAPQRDLQADGYDAATIYAFVKEPAGGAPTDVAVHLFSDGGELSHGTIRIPAGGMLATAELTADHVGEVTVDVLSTTPAADVVGERSFSVRFRAPVVTFELRPSPPEVSLLGVSEIIAELRGPGGTPIATDVARRISLSLHQGDGGIEPVEIEIPVGRSLGRASFQPSWLGAVTINGQSPDLSDRQTEITVLLPLILLTLSAAGGLAGGLLAYLVHRARPWRLLLGLVTGFVLYWMLLLLGLVELMPRAVALNPVTAFAVSIIGGWAGADVLAFATRRFGLGGGAGSGGGAGRGRRARRGGGAADTA